MADYILLPKGTYLSFTKEKFKYVWENKEISSFQER